MQPIYILEPLSVGPCEIQVPADGCARVGREATNQFSCPHDLRMSSVHFEIGMESGECRIRDLCSSNGLFLNSKRVTSALAVEGDQIQAGESQWRLTVRGDLNSSESPMLSADPLSDTARPHALYTGPASAPPKPDDLAVELLLTAGDGSSRRLSRSQTLTIGRTELAQWVFSSDGQMSSCHAELSWSSGQWIFKDLRSSNGSFINGSRITDAKLAGGDQIRLGRTLFAVSLLAPETDWGYPLDPSTVNQEPVNQGPVEPTEIEQGEIDDGEVEHGEIEDVDSDYVEISTDQIDGPSLERERTPGESTEVASEASVTEPNPESDRHPESHRLVPQPCEESEENTVQQEVNAPSPTRSSVHDLLNSEGYAEQASALHGVPCRSGLDAYRGHAAKLEPVDVCLRLLQATSGWVLNGSEIENWIEAARQGLSGLPREWLNPSHADDASWMLSFLGSWGSGNSWLLLARVELEDVLESLRSLRRPAEGEQPLLATLNPSNLTSLLADGDSVAVSQFFAPIDAILLEVGKGERWLIFARKELESILQSCGR